MLDIKSLQETVGREYVKPDVKKVAEFEKALKENPVALQYLEMQRGLNPETIAHFHLGYSAEHDAISIPIFKEGDLVNIKYRLLKPTHSKYLAEKGAENWMFHDQGIDSALKPGRILITEGEFDCMMAFQSGIPNVISPALGKDSYGVWIEKLDKIAKIYIAYDNDAAGRESGKELANRLGVDKCWEVRYPEGVKDANDFLLTHKGEEFRQLVNAGRPFYVQDFTSIPDLIEDLMGKKDDTLKIPFIPKVEIGRDWLIIVSGKSNIGKTSYVLNIADWLASNGVPNLVMPFERGIESVGKRFLQVKFDKTLQQFKDADEEMWKEMLAACQDTPVYFALPKKEEIVETIVKARRLFGTKVVIVDHLDYIVRHSSGSREAEIANTLQNLKRVAEDNGVIVIIVTHIRKVDTAGSLLQKKPGIEDLKGSSSLYQDPECVVMLTGNPERIKVDIVKNKGEMTSQEFEFSAGSGRLIDAFAEFNNYENTTS